MDCKHKNIISIRIIKKTMIFRIPLSFGIQFIFGRQDCEKLGKEKKKALQYTSTAWEPISLFDSGTKYYK